MKMKSPMKKSKDKDRDRHHKSSKDHRDGKRKREHRWVKNRFTDMLTPMRTLKVQGGPYYFVLFYPVRMARMV